MSNGASVTVPLTGLDCRDCARVVHDALRDQPGVSFVVIDPERREARVDYDPRAFGEAQVATLLQAILAGRGARAVPDLASAHARHAREPEARRHGHAAHGDDDDHEDHAHGPLGHLREAAEKNRLRLLAAVGIGLLTMAAEVVGGLLSGSLVLLSDAAHVFTDVSAIALAYVAIAWAGRPATAEKTYGFHRAEIVAAFVNALALWALAAYFVFEAFRRLADPPAVAGGILTGVAVLGLLANLVMAYVLHRGAGESVNVRSAYVHVLGDVLGSVAAVVAGAGILLFGWTWLDPATTLIVSGLILVWAYRLTRETLHILLEGTPERMDTRDLRRDVLAVEGVTDVHDLHVWTLTTGVDSMSAHIRVEDPARGTDVVRAVRRLIVPKYGLGHVTLEVEGADADCESCD